MSLTIYYDGECPVCARYVTMLRLSREQSVTMVDLRSDPVARERLEGEGFKVDNGMVVDQSGRRYAGADAVNVLALLSTPSGFVNRINRAVMSSSIAARVLYPLLRMGRWLLLFVLGKELIDERRDTASLQTIFAICFALFSIFHFCNYATAYGRFPPGPDMIALFGAAALTLLRPQSSRILALLMLVSLVSAIIQAPAQSNHTITRNFMLLGYWLSFVVAMVRNRPAGEVFSNFVIAGQGVLLVMYFFGIFHKINADFLDPVTSCAVALWEQMPAPLNALSGPWVDYPAIYGTFVIEGGIAIALLVKRWRHYGIAAGIAFHLLLAMSSYAMYIAFTMLSIAMHSLFVSPKAADRILASKSMQAFTGRMSNPVYAIAAIIVVLTIGVLAFRGSYGLASLFALPMVLPFCWVILRYGQDEGASRPYGRSAMMIGATTFAAFFLNGAMPYLGLKTAQSLNMFANLRLEQGASNHLVFGGAHRPFGYLERVATIDDAGGNRAMNYYARYGYGIVYYDLLAFLADNPDASISFTLDGKSFDSVSAVDLQADIDATLHPQWFRKWFHFQPVQLERPEPCTL